MHDNNNNGNYRDNSNNHDNNNHNNIKNHNINTNTNSNDNPQSLSTKSPCYAMLFGCPRPAPIQASTQSPTPQASDPKALSHTLNPKCKHQLEPCQKP